MSRAVNTKLIGLYVVVGIVLTIAGLVYFGGGTLFAETRVYVSYFDETLKGLNVGAPVLFRGVRVGSVLDVVVDYDEDTQRLHFPVYFEVDRTHIKHLSTLNSAARRHAFERMLEQGLRAQLDVQSFLTGMLVVQLDFFPDSEMRLLGQDPDFIEIPTVPSASEELAQLMESFRDLPIEKILNDISDTVQNVRDLPIEELLADVRKTVQGVDERVRSQEITQTIDAANTALSDLGVLARGASEQVEPLSASVVATSDEAKTTLAAVRQRMEALEQSTKATLEQARSTMATAEKLIAQDSQLHHRLTAALEELSATLRSIRVLTEFVERHPEAFLQGKNAPGG